MAQDRHRPASKLDGSIAVMDEPLTTTVAFSSTCPVPSSTLEARTRISLCCARGPAIESRSVSATDK